VEDTVEQDEKPSLRARKKLATRDALAAAAARLALVHGLDQLRVEDIAAEANVSMRTFNNYFASKQEALTARYVDRMRHAATALESRPSQEPLWNAIIEAILAQWRGSARGDLAPDRATAAELRVIYGAPTIQGEILRTALAPDHPFIRAVAARTRTDCAHDLYPRLVTAAVTSATQVAINAFLAADPPHPLVPLLREALEQIAAGLPDPTA
jgi:AcrR family transcriptional regulator